MGGRGRGNKRGRTQRRDFRDGRPNEWKRSRPEQSAPAAGAPANSEGGWIPFLMESTSFEHFYKVCSSSLSQYLALLRTLKTLSVYRGVQFVNAVHGEGDGLVCSSRNFIRV